MRKVIFSILGLCLFALVSCQKDDTPEPTTQAKLLGKWKIDRIIEEYYKPVNTLIDTEETDGREGDAVEFKSNGVVYVYSEIDGDDETTYQLLNDTTIEIEDEIYKIRKLTPTELNLYQEYEEPGMNERFTQTIYFVK